MDRREALKATSMILGYTLTAGTTMAIMHGCKADASLDWIPVMLTQDEALLLAEITETILPATDTPGAKDALCHRYIDSVLAVMKTPEYQEYFRSKLIDFNEKAKTMYAKSFVALNINEREEILIIMSEEAKEHKEEDNNGNGHIFTTIKELTIAGYCTSDIGAKSLLKYDPIPGPYQGCIDYSTVGGVWALT